MFWLLGISLLIFIGIYYVTGLDFEIGTGFSEEKSQAKEGKYTVVEPEAPKELEEKT